MLSSTGESITIEDNLNVAVALHTCGVPCRIEHLIDHEHGDRAEFDDSTGHIKDSRREGNTCRFHLEPRPTLNLPGPDGAPPLDFSTALVKRGLRDGTFSAADPCHPVCDAYAGLMIYESVRTWMERGVSFRIAGVVGGKGRCTLIRGHEPALDNPRPRIQTESLALTAALIRCGIPPLGVVGVAPYRQIQLAQFGWPTWPSAEGVADTVAMDALQLTTWINDGTLEKTHHDHPALFVLAAIHNRGRFKEAIRHGDHRRIMRNLRSAAWQKRYRCGLIHSSADSKTIDHAHRQIR